MAKGGARPGAGRPKGFAALEAEKMRALLVERLRDNWLPIVDKAVEQAATGDQQARQWLSDRGLGKVTDKLDLSNEDGTLKTIIVQKYVGDSKDKPTT